MRRLKNRGVFAAVVGVLVIAGAVLSVFGGVVARPAKAAQPTIVSHPVSVHPDMQPAGTPSNAVFSCQTNRGPGQIICYSPQQIYQAYNINGLHNDGVTGAGRTIVIIDAFQNPTMQSDLSAFDAAFGLPAPTLNIIAPNGLTPFNYSDPNQVGWAGEIALDVQWSHAIAPAATIDLVLAPSNQDQDLLNVTKWAVDHNIGDVISQSFGENENCVDPTLLKQEHAVFQEATNKGMTIFASSGDQGAAQRTCDGTSWTQVASSPASDPLVTAVGATELFAAFDCSTAHPCPPNSPTPGTYDHETALNEPAGQFTHGNFSTGGGFSDLYTRPSWQVGVANTQDGKRSVPDVAYSGSINHGVIASCGVCAGVTTPAFFVFGGTSAGSPQWAGLVALADQSAGHRLGFINEAIYKIGQTPGQYKKAFHDTTVGNNSVVEFDASNNPVSVSGFNALKGWDATTGWGTPNFGAMVPALIRFSHGASR
ncbi:MAG TPA: S53 family peptidase [Ktedonobacterales bacterium]|nr:S53 family peptidase [Ktedonobacterales bacterium]